uniref:Granulito n=1 Tax=Nothobranchius korthausae TaxID=1143690 RepID=A0A1A8FYC9_9TELE
MQVAVLLTRQKITLGEFRTKLQNGSFKEETFPETSGAGKTFASPRSTGCWATASADLYPLCTGSEGTRDKYRCGTILQDCQPP